MRKISTGIAGRNLLGSLFTQNNVLRPVVLNNPLQLSGNGTAGVEINDNNLSVSNGSLGIKTTVAGGFVNLKFAGAANYDTLLPNFGGTENQIISVRSRDTSGNIELEYKAVTIVREDDATSNTDFGIPFILTSTTEITTVKTRSTLKYNPSTDTITASYLAGDGSNLTNLKPTQVAVYNKAGTEGGTYPIFFGEFVASSGPEDMLGQPRTANLASLTDNPTFRIDTGELKATLVTASSDIALKKDIEDISNALDKVGKLRGVQYKRKNNNRNELGLIAQECESVIPSLVTGDEGNKAIAYGNITALLIEAIKEQQVMIKNLQDKVNQK